MEYDEKIDIFSAGCIIAELFSLTPLFPGKTEGLQIFEYICLLGTPQEEYYEKLKLNEGFRKFFEGVKMEKSVELKNVLNQGNEYKSTEVQDAADLVYHMLDWNYEKRFSASQCLQHKFFTAA